MLLTVGLVAPEASALQGGEDPELLPVLVDKRFGNSGRHQLGLAFSTSLASKFTEASGVFATYNYNFTDVFGIEVNGGFWFGTESAITERVREEFQTMGGEPALGDLHQLQWTAGADFVLVPLYGKMSFASEVDPGYDLFLLAGAGVVGLRRQVGFSGDNPIESAVTVDFNFGGGLRFYITELIALRVEFRNFFYPDPKSDVVEAANTDIGGLSFHFQFQGGLQLNFGGD